MYLTERKIKETFLYVGVIGVGGVISFVSTYSKSSLIYYSILSTVDHPPYYVYGEISGRLLLPRLLKRLWTLNPSQISHLVSLTNEQLNRHYWQSFFVGIPLPTISQCQRITEKFVRVNRILSKVRVYFSGIRHPKGDWVHGYEDPWPRGWVSDTQTNTHTYTHTTMCVCVFFQIRRLFYCNLFWNLFTPSTGTRIFPLVKEVFLDGRGSGFTPHTNHTNSLSFHIPPRSPVYPLSNTSNTPGHNPDTERETTLPSVTSQNFSPLRTRLVRFKRGRDLRQGREIVRGGGPEKYRLRNNKPIVDFDRDWWVSEC